jgi:hypothetical protein
MATNAKRSFLPCKILLSSNLGGDVAPSSNAFSVAAGLGPGCSLAVMEGSELGGTLIVLVI